METVSAIITSYKRNPEVLLKAIQSVEKQTYGIHEIIVVDDNISGSDYSINLQNALKNENVIYIKQTTGTGNAGACEARNLGAKHAQGDYIAFLDDDDEWAPDKIEEQLKLFNDKNVGLVFCAGTTVNENYNPVKVYDYYTLEIFKEEVTFDDILSKDHVGSTSNPLIRKDCFNKCGGFDTQMPARQDYDLWIRISKKFRILGTNKKLFIHYIHSGEQISKNSKNSMNAYIRLYQKNYTAYKTNYIAKYHIQKHIMESARNINKILWIKHFLLMTGAAIQTLIFKMKQGTLRETISRHYRYRNEC